MIKTFDDLEFKTHPNDQSGVQAKMDFENGYGVSVVRGRFSYGGSEGLYEAAVRHDGGLCYDTPITNDVLGHLSEDDVSKFLADVAALPRKAEAA